MNSAHLPALATLAGSAVVFGAGQRLRPAKSNACFVEFGRGGKARAVVRMIIETYFEPNKDVSRVARPREQ
jgi:hypothetical protein